MSNSPAAVAATADTAVTDFIPISTDVNKDTEPSSPSILVPALPQMELDEATNNAATTPNATSTNDAVDPSLYVGMCLPREAFLSTVNSYLEKHKVQCNFDSSAPKKHQPDNKYYRWRCKRGGKYESKGTGQRPNRNSLKCDCKMVINAGHPIDESNPKKKGWDTTTLVLKKLSLEHTNGCNGGADEDMNMMVLQRSGRKYPDHVLSSLRELQILLNGLQAVSPGFDFDIATDTEGRFTGTGTAGAMVEKVLVTTFLLRNASMGSTSKK
jgi:hypothetical protein